MLVVDFAAIGASRRRHAHSRYRLWTRRSIRPPPLARAAAMRGTADLGSRPGGLDATTTAPLPRELVVPTRSGLPAMALIAVIPVAAVGRF